MGIEYRYGKKIAMESLDRTILWRKDIASKMKIRARELIVAGYRTSCPICGASDVKNYATFHGITYKECLACGHLYQHEIFDPSCIKKIYAFDSSYLAYTSDEKFFMHRVKMIAVPKVEFISSYVPLKEDAEWLDIGCGSCELLYAAKQLGWKVRGIETGDIGIRQGKKFGIRVDQEYITPQNAGKLSGNAYLISLIVVLEHLHDPLQITKTILENSERCDYVSIEVPRHPSLSALSGKLFPNDLVRHLIIPDHIHIFTEKSLEILLAKCGFEITSCWKFGQDFYEIMSMLTHQADKEIREWPTELFASMNDVQFQLDKHGLSDSMLVVARRKR